MIRLKNILKEQKGLFDTVTIYASELPRSKTHVEMLNNAWHEFCQRWARQNGFSWSNERELYRKVAEHFGTPDPYAATRGPAAAAHHLRQIGALKLNLGSPRANNGVND